MAQMDHHLKVSGRTVATYVLATSRPYLHPIRTLGGQVISDAAPEDHPWHLGLSLAVQDVNGTNLWGGRTYVRDQGYTWLEDHGRITHEGYDNLAEDRVAQRLAWRDPVGTVLLRERRTMTASQVDSLSWRLALAWELTAPEKVVLGSPTTNGREIGAGYGGCFLRLAPDPAPQVSAGPLRGEAEVNGCDLPQIAWHATGYLIRAQTDVGRWFVRTGIYPGICAAWAFAEPRVIEAGRTWAGQVSLIISDLE